MSETTSAPEAPAPDDYGAVLAQMREADAAPGDAPPQEAEAPEPEAAEPEQQQASDEEREKRRRGLVGELQDEREKRKAALAEAQREREERAQLAKVVERLMATQAPPQDAPRAPELPPLDTDPVGHFQAKTEALERQLQALAAERQQAAQANDVFARVAQAEAEFSQATPDYQAAVTHLHRTFQAEEAALGLPRGYMAQAVASQALQTGKNPAEVAYQLAAARGYAKAAPASKADPIETLERGVQAARGVASVNGGAPRGALDMATIASWSPEEFSRQYAKNPDAILRIMGRDG